VNPFYLLATSACIPVLRNQTGHGSLPACALLPDHSDLLGDLGELLQAARRGRARSVNAFIAATYFKFGSQPRFGKPISSF